MLKLVFVPKWLSTALKSANVGLDKAVDLKSLSRIISPSDLELYCAVNTRLSNFLPPALVNSFQSGLPVTGCLPAEMEYDLEGMSEAQKIRFYLYGSTAQCADRGLAGAKFTVNRIQYDYLVITISDEPLEQFDGFYHLMDDLLEQLNATVPLQTLSTVPLFVEWLKLVGRGS